MKILLAILLNAALLTVLLPWLRRQWREAPTWVRWALVWGLGTRLLVGAWRGGILANDALNISLQADSITRMLRAQPSAFLRTLHTGEVAWHHQIITYNGMSNTLFSAKVVGLLNIASADQGWLNGMYLSLLSFIGCWVLARTVARVFPATPPAAAMVAFVAWPTVIFWAAGVAKEPLLLGSGAWLLAVFLSLFYESEARPSRARAGQVVGLLVLAYVHFNMRYFFAAPLLGVLVGLAVLRAMQHLRLARSRWAQALVLVAVLAGGAWAATEVGVAFRVNKFINQTIRIYTHSLDASASKPHFEYSDLRPTGESFVQHAPLAVANAFTRPWLGESWQPMYVAASLENAVLLFLLAVAMVAAWRRQSGRLPFQVVLALGIFCIILAVLLGLSTPNLGSLNRYRSAMLPYAVLLLLQNGYAAAGLRRLGLGPPAKAPVPLPDA